MKTVAIIPAGGSGKRLKSHIAKQYLLIDSVPVLIHTLKVFQNSNDITEIVIALPQEDIAHMKQELIENYGLTKVVHIVTGGKERQDSVKNCLTVLQKDCEIAVIHDAVRPFVTTALIKEVIDAAKKTGAAIAGVKIKDTVKSISGHHFIEHTVPRQNLWLAQTPQAFEFKLLKEAYRRAGEENFTGTDDASLVERIGKEVTVVEGSYENIKITTNEDVQIANAFMKNRNRNKSEYRSGFGYDSHRFAEGRKLILGGVEIPFHKGLLGHSDADALVHAICDALLGAAGAGDIGRHFPDTDPEFKNISSMILLKRVREMIVEKGLFINNLDATVVMEAPRLAPYAVSIVSNIAQVLKIPESCINIKAKTNEGMGFTGTNEGIAVFAVAALRERNEDGSNA
jgi:2-C-methyl-D-erythritol 4-phosphate cytidylyltransferase/2-C-methyl-D-erythritol 2,4-cyclodiphosphate synthase